MGGVTVELYDEKGKLVASTQTSPGGKYAFRFPAPGTYTIRIVVLKGYTTDTPSVTLKIGQFETLRVDFTLKKS